MSKEGLEEDNCKVRVVIRIRPLIEEEFSENKLAAKIVVKPHADSKRLILASVGAYDREFEFDYVAHYKNTTQESFYTLVGEPRIDDIFKGINSTIIAYGQVNWFALQIFIDWLRKNLYYFWRCCCNKICESANNSSTSWISNPMR